MKLLLDTHALLWWLFDDPALSMRARDAIADRANTVYVSSASAWELATKRRLGRLPQAEDAVKKLPELLSVAGFVALPITVAHALAAGFFAAEHRDPFDRMLIAQAAIEGLRLVSKDSVITALIAEVLW